MTADHLDDAGRALLTGLLSGDRTETEPEVAAMLQRDPALRAELAALRSLVADLDSSGRATQSEVDAARRQVTADDVATARRAIARHLGQVRRSKHRVWLLAAAIAAVLLPVVGYSLWAWRPGNPEDPRLGTTPPKVEAWPDGADIERTSLDHFLWHAVMPRGGHWSVVVHATRGGQKTGTVVIENPDITDSQWLLNKSDQQRIQAVDEFCWDLIAYDSANVGKVLATFTVQLRR